MRNQREAGIALLTAMLLLLLMTALTLGFAMLLMTDQRVTGWDKNYSRAWYGAEAGMEKMTDDLATLFSANFAPTAAQIAAIAAAPPAPVDVPGIRYLNPDNSSGYRITFPPDGNGNPAASIKTILSGPYSGLSGLITPYTLTITTRASDGGEVKLQRFTQTAAIPVFQFGIFSQTDLSFFAGPNFNFGGRVHTNGNLFLAEGNGNTLSLTDRVTAVGRVVRDHLANGWDTNANYTGTINICTSSCTAGPPPGGAFANLAYGEGSVYGPTDTSNATYWQNTTVPRYNGNLRNGTVGVTPLNLPFVTLGATPIDLIRRPLAGELNGILGQRYFAHASFRVLLSDTAADITGLQCVSAGAPTPLTDLLPSSWPNWYSAASPNPIPLAASAAQAGNYTPFPGDGYWLPNGVPTITGFIKIEIQTAQGNPCGAFQDVTQEVLNFGIAGRNLFGTNNPVPNPGPFDLTFTQPAAPPGPPVGPLASSNCPDASPNAIIRLQRVRDNPSNGAGPNGPCGVNLANVPPAPTNSGDYWPNVLFDTREGNLRDVCLSGTNPCNTPPTLGGVMHYVELDVNNLARYLTGALPGNGTLAKDPANATNNFVVYFSDRRGNHNMPAGNAVNAGTETGRYGFGDFVNPANQWGCPNGVMDQGEDLEAPPPSAAPPVYGQNAIWPEQVAGTLPPALNWPTWPTGPNFTRAQLLGGVVPGTPVVTPHPNCGAPATPWPGYYYKQATPTSWNPEARENPPLFFRRALKVRNGNNINLGACPGGTNCGLTIVAENPVYVQGDFNANSAGGGFADASVAAAVIGDTFTFLSNNWNDINSFSYPYNPGRRPSLTSWFRMGIIAGKGINFPQPAGYPTPQDFGTDGGTHNFLRYLESWGGTTLNYRGSIVSLYYNRQAIGVYKCCNTVYSPPSRGYNFDVNFLTPALLPPRTPMFRDLNTTGFVQFNRANQ